MPGAFHGIDLAARALRSFQRAMDVTGQNVANINTPGYSRQTVDFASSDPISFFSHKQQFLGSGVGITSINRIRELFLDARRNEANSDMQQYSTAANNLQQIEAIYNEPGEQGLSNALDKFFNSWSGLSSAPTDIAARVNVRLSAQNLVDRIRGSYQSLQAMNQQTTGEIQSTIGEINQISSQIGELNNQIRAASTDGAQPNDLLDRRDQAIAQLSSLININTNHNQDGTISVFSSQFTLVDSSGSKPYPTNVDPVNMQATDGTDNFTIRSGKLIGLFQSANASKQGMLDMDQMADSLRSQINSLHRTGTNTPGTPPVPDNINFFEQVSPPGTPLTGASTLALSSQVLASPANIMTSTAGLSGDGGLALSLSNLRNATFMGGKTISTFHKDNMSSLGQQVSYATYSRQTQSAILTQIDSQQQAVSGVSIDDEMSNMLRFQKSYQAAAKVLAIFDQAAEDIIGMIR